MKIFTKRIKLVKNLGSRNFKNQILKMNLVKLKKLEKNNFI